MGGVVESVVSQATRSRNDVFAQYEYATTSVTLVKFSDGRLGKVASVIDCLQPYYFHTHLVGSAGSLLDNRFHSTRIDGLDRGAWSALAMKLLDSGDVSDHPYRTQFDAFFAALERGEDMPLTNLREGLASHRVVLAADRSATLGREVRLEELA
jgi:predicted dehydrogenase